MKLVVKNVSLVIDSSLILDNVSLEVNGGEVLGLFGPNGAGKTSLLKTIAGMLSPRQGVVMVSGVELAKLSRRDRARLVAYLPPYLDDQGFRVTVYDVVSMASYAGGTGVGVEEALSMLGIEHLASRTLESLSSGELQLTLIAHALARDVEVLLVDEPTAFLDLANRVKVLRLLRKVARSRDIAVVVATHDIVTAYRFVDKALLLKNGRVIAAGRVEEVLTPENIKAAYGIDVHVVKLPEGIVLLPRG